MRHISLIVLLLIVFSGQFERLVVSLVQLLGKMIQILSRDPLNAKLVDGSRLPNHTARNFRPEDHLPPQSNNLPVRKD